MTYAVAMSALDGPRISVFIPVRNGGPWLRAAIDSVLAQTSGAWELVIGDNASTDETAAIATSFADPRIRSIRWETSTEAFENFNRTRAECATDWAYILPADDRLKPRFVERVLAVIDDADPGGRLAMVTTAAAPVDPEGRSVATGYFGVQGVRQVAEGTYDAAGWLAVCARPGAAPWSSGAYRRSIVEEMGRFYRTDIPNMSADLELAVRVSAYGDVAYIAEPLVDVVAWPASHTHGRIGRNMASGEPFTPQGRALTEGLRVHQARRAVADSELVTVRAAVARSFLRRAMSQRTVDAGRGRRGALGDVLRAVRLNPRTVVREAPRALALVVAPRWSLDRGRSRALARRDRATRPASSAAPTSRSGPRPG